MVTLKKSRLVICLYFDQQRGDDAQTVMHKSDRGRDYIYRRSGHLEHTYRRCGITNTKPAGFTLILSHKGDVMYV